MRRGGRPRGRGGRDRGRRGDARSEDGDGRLSVKPTVKLYESRSRTAEHSAETQKAEESGGGRLEEKEGRKQEESSCLPRPVVARSGIHATLIISNFRRNSRSFVPLRFHPSIFIPPASSSPRRIARSQGRVAERARAKALDAGSSSARCDTSATLIRNSVDLSIKSPCRLGCQYRRRAVEEKGTADTSGVHDVVRVAR